VSAADASAAEKLAQQAVASPVTVSVGETTATLAPETIAQALSFTTQGNQLSPELDGAVLHASIANALKRAETPGRNASFKIANGSPFVVPSVVGTGVSDSELATAVLGVLSAEGNSRSVSVPLGIREPELTTAAAQQLGINAKLSSFTQNFPYAAYRVTNIGQAARYIDDTILMPGETFSMNDTIKERTVKNGYTVGTIIGPGGVFEDALGGGVSAATTAMWTAAFFAGMERTDTRAHSLYISRYQPGLEATVAWGFFDMKFTNDSPTAVLIKTKMTNSSMKVTFWGTRQYDSIEADFGERINIKQPKKIVMTNKKCVPQAGIEGFTITVDRVFVKDGVEVIREPMTTVYNAGPNVVCKKKPKLEDLDPSGSEFDNSSPSPSASQSPSTSAKPAPSTN
jgi:vancomycin resistance protein YoaR